MFSADPFSNISFCGSTVTPVAPVYPYVMRDIHRQVLELKLAKPIIELNVGTERTVLVLKIAAISLNLIRK